MLAANTHLKGHCQVRVLRIHQLSSPPTKARSMYKEAMSTEDFMVGLSALPLAWSSK